ncbi:ATP-binding cassette domain-containing protein [Tessaracoccus sp. SD287]|uniref:energy-coupling factor ABC transporter ATP-binding protein n=1 Tax=Tessaracoccus sp. SD287 TaxID=2782008 RepID=UPI001A9796D2|nr:ATP-binding cassette domain-containing protein [Tessaracoccus sp. SD287]MBO1030433.1 ATP-binding cassette domain-containing protein [Tessaracoccus sp. SD287]
MNLLAADHLSASFPDRPPVLDDASLIITRGRRLALLGANGSGKTTLLRCLSGALRPDTGRVLLDGVPLGQDRASLRQHRRMVQLVLQDPDDQLFSADVTQDISFGPLNLGLDQAEARARVQETLGLLGITHLADRPTHHLSYGERKRVAIAGAVAMHPRVLLLDEPTAGLDPIGVHDLLQTLAGLSSTVVLATHDVDLVFAWADEVAIVADHQVHQGTTALLTDTGLLAAARLRRPWQVDVLEACGIRPHHPLPRTATDVAAILKVHQ